MDLKNFNRKLKAKVLKRPKVLFSTHHSWGDPIKEHLIGYKADFSELEDTDYTQYDYYIPLTIQAQNNINASKELHKVFHSVIPSKENIELCNDKEAFRDYLMNSGYAENSVKTGNDLPYPYVLKQKVGRWGDGIFMVKNEADEQAVVKEPGVSYFKEEFIPGKKEYATHVFIYRGKIKFMKTVEYVYDEEFAIKGPNYKPLSEDEINHKHYK